MRTAEGGRGVQGVSPWKLKIKKFCAKLNKSVLSVDFKSWLSCHKPPSHCHSATNLGKLSPTAGPSHKQNPPTFSPHTAASWYLVGVYADFSKFFSCKALTNPKQLFKFILPFCFYVLLVCETHCHQFNTFLRHTICLFKALLVLLNNEYIPCNGECVVKHTKFCEGTPYLCGGANVFKIGNPRTKFSVVHEASLLQGIFNSRMLNYTVVTRKLMTM